jgi:hypothetical protein
MFRKTFIALATTAALGAAALAPTSASAGPHHFGHGWWGPGLAAGIIGTAIAMHADRCWHREVFRTPYGWRSHWVNVCY